MSSLDIQNTQKEKPIEETNSSSMNNKSNINPNTNINLNQNNQIEEENNEEELNNTNSEMEVNITTYEIKLVFIGDSNVGKTSIIRSFCEHKFDEAGIISTVSVAYNHKKLKVDPFTEVHMKIWDTAGQEKYRSMTRGYLRGANGIFLVFDLGLKKSFDSLNSWLNEIKSSDVDENCVKMLIGNKYDFKEKEINEEEAKKFAEENNMKYISVSAKDGVNIESMFEIMGDTCAKAIQELPEDEKSCNKSKKSSKKVMGDNNDNKPFNNISDSFNEKISKKIKKQNPSCC
jgi:small GTP-binding protein